MERLDAFLEQIETALDAEAFLPALALALVLPDVCVTLQRPRRRSRTTAHQYKLWCARWVDQRTVTNTQHLWPLRCAFLHNGATNPSTQDRWRTVPEYLLSKSGGGIVLGLTKTDIKTRRKMRELTASVHDVCEALIRGVRKWQHAKASDANVRRNLASLIELRA